MVSKLSIPCILNEWPQPLIKGNSPSEFPVILNNSAKSFYSVKTFFFIIWVLRHNSLFLINLFSPCSPQKSHIFFSEELKMKLLYLYGFCVSVYVHVYRYMWRIACMCVCMYI